MSDTAIQTGLAAFGMSGEVFHGPLLQVHPGFVLRKIVERRTNKAAQRYPEAETVRHFQALLYDPALELIIVNTPNALHYEMAQQALLAGKHVVIEKPFTVTFEEAQRLIALAQQQNRILTAFQNRRWDSDFLTVQRVVQQGLLGPLVEYEAHYDRFRNYVEANTWKEEAGPGSGLLYNLGSHLIDQALVLFGMPQRITADIRVQRPGGQVPDAYTLQLEYATHRATLKSSYLVREAGPRYVLHGVLGSFVKYGIDPQEEALKAGRLPHEARWGAEPETDWGTLHTEVNGLLFRGQVTSLSGNYPAFYNNVYQAIRRGAPLAVKPEEAADVIRLIEAAQQSSRERRSVALTE